jgi:hypothetical protein
LLPIVALKNGSLREVPWKGSTRKERVTMRDPRQKRS